MTFTIAEGGGVPAPNCPEFDERLTVIVGTVDTGVPNRITRSRCTINELIEDEKDWSSHALFLKHVDKVLDKLLADGVIDQREHKKIYQGGQAVRHRQAGPERPATAICSTARRRPSPSGSRWAAARSGSTPTVSMTSGTTVAAWACCGSRSGSTGTSR